VSSVLGFVDLPAHAAAASSLSAGQSLAAGQELSSPDGSYSAVMQHDGNFVVYGAGQQAIWQSGTGGNGDGGLAAMQHDGNFVVYSAAHAPLFSTSTAPSIDNRLVMQNDGNLVLYTGGGRPLWSSITGRSSSSADSLSGGQILTGGQFIYSLDGSYSAVMQHDGNFVVYGAGQQAIWQSGTGGNGDGGLAAMQHDGNFVVYSAAHAPLFSTSTAPSIDNRLVMQNDGNLVLYAARGHAVWSSLTGRIGRWVPPPGVVTKSLQWHPDPSPRLVALTFDDGPNQHTPALLDILRDHGVRATFFVVGDAIYRNPGIVRRMVAEGHAVAAHTMRHADLTRLSPAGQASEIYGSVDLIESITGPGTVHCLRPPYGAYSSTTMTLARDRGLGVVLWSRDTNDWRGRTTAQITAAAVDGSLDQNRGIVLMHDRTNTVSALPTVISTLQAQGYEFENIC
jgi:peptidoglycan/xylan/chitin deacetylase (PgdA/CDA1 family)